MFPMSTLASSSVTSCRNLITPHGHSLLQFPFLFHHIASLLVPITLVPHALTPSWPCRLNMRPWNLYPISSKTNELPSLPICGMNLKYYLRLEDLIR
ncbi:hypothetical protein HZ326_24147 [Fusarium oxysporum f. sp. albedinis]|nr:hypothetical protein HZ326_24147 [Fusarium oxysporum f. sp. albedinis]